jgi:hypothetical protein
VAEEELFPHSHKTGEGFATKHRKRSWKRSLRELLSRQQQSPSSVTKPSNVQQILCDHINCRSLTMSHFRLSSGL